MQAVRSRPPVRQLSRRGAAYSVGTLRENPQQTTSMSFTLCQGVVFRSLRSGLRVDARGVQVGVSLAFWQVATRRPRRMESEALRLLIRTKLQQGMLPHDGIPRVSGITSSGEMCDACDLVISPPELLLEGISLSGDALTSLLTHYQSRPLRFHIACFCLWDLERRR